MAVQTNGQQVSSLVFRESIHDFGEIEEEKGKVNCDFVFTNTSALPVKIISVEASCGCTTPGWSQNPIQPGKTGYIKASFEPRGRPGYFNKSLSVTTDSDPTPVLLQIRGNVRSGLAQVKTVLDGQFGNLSVESKTLNFEKIFINKEPAHRQFLMMNAGTQAIEFRDVSVPPYIKVELPLVIGPKARGYIKVTYDAAKRNQFGFYTDTIQITTNDPGNEVKLIPIVAYLEEYYPLPAASEFANGPLMYIKDQSIDLGHQKPDARIEKVISIKNPGKKELLIKAVQGNCVCINAEVEKKTILPGDSSRLKILFTPQNRGGTQMKAVTIYSNDPLNTVQRVNVQAYIED